MKTVGRRLIKHAPLALKRKLYFLKAHHRWPNLGQPVSFNEKVNWRIVYDRRKDLE